MRPDGSCGYPAGLERLQPQFQQHASLWFFTAQEHATFLAESGLEYLLPNPSAVRPEGPCFFTGYTPVYNLIWNVE